MDRGSTRPSTPRERRNEAGALSGHAVRRCSVKCDHTFYWALSACIGHTQLSTTERYIRQGRLMARARGERVFPVLPSLLLRR